MSLAIRLISNAIPKKRAAQPGIGVVPFTHLLGVFLPTSAMRQKSDCFQSKATNAAANASGVIISPSSIDDER
jgi:hypothetical protein